MVWKQRVSEELKGKRTRPAGGKVIRRQVQGRKDRNPAEAGRLSTRRWALGQAVCQGERL